MGTARPIWLMTSGGVTPQQQWREVDYFPFTVLHKKWQYHLFTMLKQRVGTRALKAKIDRLGPVNMMAIEQFDELEQRHGFLTAQRKDLIDLQAEVALIDKRLKALEDASEGTSKAGSR